MSARVNVAFRLRQSADLWPLVHDIRVRAVANCQKVLIELYEGFATAFDDSGEEQHKFNARVSLLKDEGMNPEDAGYLARLSMVEDKLRRGYREQVNSPFRNEFHFDVSVVFREHEGRIYLIPYCDMFMRRVLDFLKDDKRLSDYAYWNNVEQPEGISDRVWKQRGKLWDTLTDKWADMLTLDIIDKENFFQIDPSPTHYAAEHKRCKLWCTPRP